MKEWALPTLETQNRASTGLTKSILVVQTPVPSLKGIWVWAGALWDVGTDTEGDVGGGTKPGGLPEEGHSRWLGNPDQGPQEEKQRPRFTSEHLINVFKKSKLLMVGLFRHKLYFSIQIFPKILQNLTSEKKTKEFQELILFLGTTDSSVDILTVNQIQKYRRHGTEAVWFG